MQLASAHVVRHGSLYHRAVTDQSEVIASLERSLQADADPSRAVRLHLVQLLIEASRAGDAFDHCRLLLAEDPGDKDALDLAAAASEACGEAARAIRYRDVLHALGQAESKPLADPPKGRVEPLRVIDGDGARAGGAVADELERSTITLADVAGMERAKRRIQLAFLGPLRNPQLRSMYRKSLRGGLLLWGPPGCGKTYLGRAIAGELGARFVAVGLEDVLSMWFGKSEHQLHELFEEARRTAPSVLFFDEVDALGHKRGNLRGSAGRNIVAQFLSELDGLGGQNDGVFVIGATNAPWDVDAALRRPGRFDRMVLVLPPDRAARATILRWQLVDRPADGIDIGRLATATRDFSGADLVHLCDTAAELALESCIETGETRSITHADFDRALEEVGPSTAGWFHIARNYAEFAGRDQPSYRDLLTHLDDRSRHND